MVGRGASVSVPDDPSTSLSSCVAEPVVEDIDRGEEGEQCSSCRHCGGPVFMDFHDTDYESGEQIIDDTCYWQHNDERYVPGQPSPCGPSENWEALRA
jgi:hypothetical protein